MTEEKFVDYAKELYDDNIALKKQNDELFESRLKYISENKNLKQEVSELKEKVEYQRNKINNKDNWCQLIADIGYDYDGYNSIENLKSLIDELVKYSLYARDGYNYDDFIEDGGADE